MMSKCIIENIIKEVLCPHYEEMKHYIGVHICSLLLDELNDIVI